ncbi:MAG: hypothetical protein GX457_13335 [Thermotogaceae bacterium]|nr:hypothetical protein [Thermotogaceae bacterium]
MEEILVAIDLLGIIRIAGGKVVVSKKVLKLVSSAALSDNEKIAVIALAKKATTQAKKNPQAYWIKIVEEKDRDELTENDLQEAKDFMKLCETFRYKSFEAPGLEELKRLMSVLLKQTSAFKDRNSLVDYLQLKAHELEERLEKYKALLPQPLS